MSARSISPAVRHVAFFLEDLGARELREVGERVSFVERGKERYFPGRFSEAPNPLRWAVCDEHDNLHAARIRSPTDLRCWGCSTPYQSAMLCSCGVASIFRDGKPDQCHWCGRRPHASTHRCREAGLLPVRFVGDSCPLCDWSPPRVVPDVAAVIAHPRAANDFGEPPLLAPVAIPGLPAATRPAAAPPARRRALRWVVGLGVVAIVVAGLALLEKFKAEALRTPAARARQAIQRGNLVIAAEALRTLRRNRPRSPQIQRIARQFRGRFFDDAQASIDGYRQCEHPDHLRMNWAQVRLVFATLTDHLDEAPAVALDRDLAQGFEMIEAGYARDALPLFYRARQTCRDCPLSLDGLAHAYRDMEPPQFENARSQLFKLLARNPGSSRAHLHLAEIELARPHTALDRPRRKSGRTAFWEHARGFLDLTSERAHADWILSNAIRRFEELAPGDTPHSPEALAGERRDRKPAP